MISTNDFQALTDDLESIFVDIAASKIADSVGMDLFGVKDEVRQTHKHQLLHGVSGVKKVAQGADLPSVTGEEGDSIIYTQSRYGALVTVTKDMRMFDLHDQIEDTARSISEDAFDRIDQSFADMFLYGWATSHVDVYDATVTDTTAPDGLAFFSASHTYAGSGQTFTNIIHDGTNPNPALSRTAVVAERANARKHKDKNGLLRPIKLDTIVVSPDLEDLAMRIVESNLIQGSANNDTNTSGLRSMKVIVWDRLSANSAGTDTSAFWFMLDSSKAKMETLKALFAQRPNLMPPDEVYKNKNWDYSIDFYYSRGLGFPAFVRGSNGTAS